MAGARQGPAAAVSVVAMTLLSPSALRAGFCEGGLRRHALAAPRNAAAVRSPAAAAALGRRSPEGQHSSAEVGAQGESVAIVLQQPWMDMSQLWDKDGELDAYAVLRVSPLSDEDAIRKAFVNVCKTDHPDLNDGKESQWWLLSKESHRILTTEKAKYDVRRGIQTAAVVANGLFKVVSAFATAASVVASVGFKFAMGPAKKKKEKAKPKQLILLPAAEEPAAVVQTPAEQTPAAVQPAAASEKPAAPTPAAPPPLVEKPALSREAVAAVVAEVAAAGARGAAAPGPPEAPAAAKAPAVAEVPIAEAPLVAEALVGAAAAGAVTQAAKPDMSKVDAPKLTPEEVEEEGSLRDSAAKVLRGARRLREKAQRLRTLLDQ